MRFLCLPKHPPELFYSSPSIFRSFWSFISAFSEPFTYHCISMRRMGSTFCLGRIYPPLIHHRRIYFFYSSSHRRFYSLITDFNSDPDFDSDPDPVSEIRRRPRLRRLRHESFRNKSAGTTKNIKKKLLQQP